MRYFKLIYYTTGLEYETNEILMNEPFFRQIQKAIVENKDYILLEDRVIKRSSIKEITPADEIVKEYLGYNLSLKSIGIREVEQLESGEKDKSIKRLWH